MANLRKQVDMQNLPSPPPTAEDPVQAAYGALLDHLSTCAQCTDATGCTEAQRLRSVYKHLRHQKLEGVS